MASQLSDALLRWISTFGGDVIGAERDVSDGVSMARVLNRIDAAHFDEDWLSTVREDIPRDNKRLKVNNLKKVLAAIRDYSADVLGMSFRNDFASPDVNLVAEGDLLETGRLVQLMLGCAVNCENKQKHIQTIMNMEESVQQLIMQAIQELIDHQVVSSDNVGATAAGGGLMSQTDVQKLVEDLQVSNREREQLKQKCHELDNQVALLQDEKLNFALEIENLQGQLGKGPSSSLIHKEHLTFREKEFKRQIESAQEDLYKIEKERDEFHVKIEQLEKQVEDARSREAELKKIADEARALKDELDVLRETSDKVTKYEAAIDSYKKKLEEVGDVKRQLKRLEEKNTTLVQTNMDLEEDVRKTGNWRPQMDAYKKQMTELHSKLEAETTRADKLEFEAKQLLEKVETLSVQRDRLQAERDTLKEAHDELTDQMKLEGAAGLVRASEGLVSTDPDSGILEMIPPSVKERLLRLQHENLRLKALCEGGDPDGKTAAAAAAPMKQLLEDMRERERKLETSNRKLNQRILELEAQVEEEKTGGCQKVVVGNAGVASTSRVPGSREELELKLSEANGKVTVLQDMLHKKEVEMQGMEERYKKYIEKAKSVLKTLDPKQNSSSVPEVSALRSQLSEKDRLIETLEQETDKTRVVREMEERLISSAFYNLSMHMHRAAVENRLSNAHSPSSQHGQSFLVRQRQAGMATSSGSTQIGSSNGSQHNFIDY